MISFTTLHYNLFYYTIQFYRLTLGKHNVIMNFEKNAEFDLPT